MNAEIQAFLLQQLERVNNGIDHAVAFTAEQLPLFVQEFIAFKLVWAWVEVGLGIVIILASLWFVRWRYKRDEYEDGSSWIVGGPGMALGLLVVLFNLHTITMITYAPRVYLVTELIKLTKGTK